MKTLPAALVLCLSVMMVLPFTLPHAYALANETIVPQSRPDSTIATVLAPTIGNYTWVEFGPKPISSQAPFTTFGATPMSGRVSAIAVNSSNPQTIYLGSAHGGVWKSADGGSTWISQTDNQASLAIGAITLSPDQKTLYVGTGEAGHTGDTYYGEGLLKSTDGGRSWITLGLKYFGNSSISSVLVQSTDQSRILVSTTWGACCGRSLASSTNPSGTGIYLSLDGGNTWPTIFQTPATYPYNGFAQLLADPTDSSIVYAGDFAGKIWRSTNFGSTWSLFAGYSTPSLQGRVALAMTPAKPNALYAAFSSAAGELNGIFRYNVTAGVVATLATPSGPPAYPTQTACGFQCNYDLVLAVNPSNPSILYFGARDLYVSTDAGGSWADRGGLWYPQQSQVHPDQHALALVGGLGMVLDGNDGGIWKSTDQGLTWTNLNGGLGTAELYSLALSPSSTANPSIIAGSQDNGMLAYYSNSSWSQRITGDVVFTGFERTNANIAYMYDVSAFYKSVDGGNTWNIANTGLNPNDPNLFLSPVAQDPNSPGTLYIGGTDVYKTTNFASTWTDASGPLANPGRITAMVVAPSNSAIIYLGDINGLVRVSTNGGVNWRTILSTVVSPVSSIDVDPTNSSIVYVSYARPLTPLIETTSNQGASWTTTSTTGLPAAAIVYVKVLNVGLFVGTDIGVYYSTKSGVSWSRLGIGLPNVPTYGIAIISNCLYVATLGRGIWKTFVVSFAATLFEFDWADWNNDNKVTILDAAQLAFCFDATPSSPIWSSCKYWDLYLQNRVTILDAALVAFLFDQTSGSSPFPGQGQPSAQMDPTWKSSCSTLTPPDPNYCNTLT